MNVIHWILQVLRQIRNILLVENKKELYQPPLLLLRESSLEQLFCDCYLYCLSDHYSDIIMSAIVAPITRLMIVYSTVYSGTDQRKPQSAASLAFMRGIHRWLGNSPHHGPVTWKMFPFDDVIMYKGMQFVSSKYDLCSFLYSYYRQTSNRSCTLISNKIVDHSDVVHTTVKLLI